MTRDRKEIETEWNGRAFVLVDTGGVDLEDGDALARSSRTRRAPRWPTPTSPCSWSTPAPGCARATTSSPTLLRARRRRRCVVAANKIDAPRDSRTRPSSTRLGLGEPSPVSAAQGLGTGDLLDASSSCCPSRPTTDEDDETPSASP